jgi:hypothetical protein
VNDDSASPRHRIESARELRNIATVGPEAAPMGDRFIIQINLGADVEYYSKSRAIDPNDVDPHNPNTAPQELLSIIAANKREDGGNGEPI